MLVVVQAKVRQSTGVILMRKACPICEHPNAGYVDRDLSSGFSVHHVLLKHFGDYSLVNVLKRHKRFHLLPGKSTLVSDNKVTIKNRSRVRMPSEPFIVADPSERELEKPIIAVEAMRVKGIVYQAGEVIPESMWTPAYLSAALRAGTVRRRRRKVS